MQCNPTKYKCLPLSKIHKNISSLNHIVNNYIDLRRPDIDSEFKWLRNISSNDELIKLASYAIQSDGNRNSHHYRKSSLILEKVYKVLKKEKTKLFSLKSFEDVHDYFENTFYDFVGIRELYYYDTSLMICASKNIYPQYVYLHSGTRKGACALGLPYKEKYLTMSQIPKELRVLRPYEIEDVLCIYKDYLSKFKVT